MTYDTFAKKTPIKMLVIDPTTIATRDLHQYMLGAVAPRPIAFVSTIDADGKPNLAPYSFFNAFSSNPPLMVFSSNRRVTNGTTKDTLANVLATKECVINVVSYAIVQQMALASVEFDTGINEFEKSGLTPIASDIVKPFRVKESPVQMECVVEQIQPLGDKGGAGNLVFCRLVRMHISEDIIDDNNRIDPHKIDLMGRMGRSYYSRNSGEAIHTIVQEVTKMVIGYDALPAHIRTSNILTGNEIALLGGCAAIPTTEEILDNIAQDIHLQAIVADKNIAALHHYTRVLLQANAIQTALQAAFALGMTKK